jgi:outer membrane receptor for ferrienterochelin and colicins
MRIFKFQIVLTVLFCSVTGLYAQMFPVELVFTDPEGSAIQNVTTTYGEQQRLSDAYGRVLIYYRDTGAIYFSHPDFETGSVIPVISAAERAAGGKSQNIILRPRAIEVGGPVIIRVEDKSSALMRSQTVAVVSMPQYLIRNRNPTDPTGLAEQIPGVNVIDGQVNIRSGSGWSYGAGSRVMVLVDNLPMLSGDAGQVQWSFLPQELFQSIDVLKGTGSVLYGSSALNGVINIRTMQPAAKPRTGINTFWGWYDKPERESLRWSDKPLQQRGISFWDLRRSKNGRTGFRFSGNHVSDDGYRMQEFSRRTRVQAGIQHRFSPSTQFSLDAGLMGSNSGSFLLWESHQLGYTSLDSGYNHSRSTRFHFDPRLQFGRGRLRHTVHARYLSIDNQNSTSDLSSGDQSNATRMLYAEYRISGRIKVGSGQLETAGGFVLMEADTRSPLFSGEQTTGNRAAYLQADYSRGKLKLSGGLRYEYFRLNEITDARPVMRIGANYRLFRFLELRGSWGEGYRFPTIAESFIKTSVGPVKVYPNSGLKPETGSNAEAGMRAYVIGRKTSGMFFDAAIFDMRFQNMMEFTFSQWSSDNSPANLFGFGFKSVNVGSSRVSGHELTMGGEFRTGRISWQTLAGYTHTNPRVDDPDFIYGEDSLGRKLTFRETRSDDNNWLKYRFRTMWRADLQCAGRKWELGISYRYNSAIENIDKAFVALPVNLFIPDVQKGRDAGSQGVGYVDLRAAWKPRTGTRLAFIVNNAGNREFMARPADIRAPRSFQLQLLHEI